MTKEEAIDNVRSFIDQLTAECQESIHTLIPELAESEDERVRKALIDGIRQIRCKNSVTQEQMLAWLEKQKPTEWSEEDKTHLCWIIECFNSWKYQVPEFADQYQSAIDWLKSLRPDSYKNCNSRWKPSEEQMEALENSTALTEKQGEALYSLVQDLKKL